MCLPQLLFGGYIKKPVVPTSDVTLTEKPRIGLFANSFGRVTITSPSFFSDIKTSPTGIDVEKIGSLGRDSSKYIQTSEAVNNLAAEKINLHEYLLAFRRASRSGNLEYGMVSKCDELILQWFGESNEQLGRIISHIFIQSMNDKNILLFLLKAISNVSYAAIYPFGQTVAVAALVNRDIEVIEGGIRAFENWGSRDGISVLENTKLAFDWLEVYRRQTIDYLREF